MKVTISLLTWNEELLLPFALSFYKNRFPNCVINIYDNMSDDRTVEIAKREGCNVFSYDTGGQIQDAKYLEIKNNCWKDAKTDWVLVGDIDELLDINEHSLQHEENLGHTIIKTEGYHLVNKSTDPDNANLYGMAYGIRAVPMDKSILFNKKFIKEINFDAGCHVCFPVGDVRYSANHYRLYHYKFIGENYTVNRTLSYGKRLSEFNKSQGWGMHYLMPEKELREWYKGHQKAAEVLLFK